MSISFIRFFFFFNDTATTEIYTLSLHDALPICDASTVERLVVDTGSALQQQSRDSTALRRRTRTMAEPWRIEGEYLEDRKSTRLNSSHLVISYAVFCLKKKKEIDSSSRVYSCTL